MDLASKELLKRDLFVQDYPSSGRLPSAATFADALHQARAAEEQDTLLGSYTGAAHQISHQISHHLQDPLPRIKVSEEENWRRERT